MDGCPRISVAWGWCDFHYRRLTTYGDPSFTPPRGGRVGLCAVCTHPDLVAIEKRMRAGGKSGLYPEISYGSWTKHKGHHLDNPDHAAAAAEAAIAALLRARTVYNRNTS